VPPLAIVALAAFVMMLPGPGVKLQAVDGPLPAAPLDVPQAPPGGGCDAAAISAGVGQSVSVLRCYGDWAYVTNGELGDSTMLVHLQSYGWRHYTGFPSNVCRDMAINDGVPAAELSSFPNCVSGPVIP
jgi:hypothetical protein